jgi:hypothetical protein
VVYRVCFSKSHKKMQGLQLRLEPQIFLVAKMVDTPGKHFRLKLETPLFAKLNQTKNCSYIDLDVINLMQKAAYLYL